jgi:hypothetical protein
VMDQHHQMMDQHHQVMDQHHQMMDQHHHKEEKVKKRKSQNVMPLKMEHANLNGKTTKWYQPPKYARLLLDGE